MEISQFMQFPKLYRLNNPKTFSPSQFNEGDVLTFANGMIGCVTKEWYTGYRHVALIDKRGWTISPKYMPTLDIYLSKYGVVDIEKAVIHDRFDLAA